MLPLHLLMQLDDITKSPRSDEPGELARPYRRSMTGKDRLMKFRWGYGSSARCGFRSTLRALHGTSSRPCGVLK